MRIVAGTKMSESLGQMGVFLIWKWYSVIPSKQFLYGHFVQHIKLSKFPHQTRRKLLTTKLSEFLGRVKCEKINFLK